MNAKITLLLAALVGVGLFALPQTMALFAGQHSFINIDPSGNQIDCVKCHGDIQAEIDSETNALSGTLAPHANMECEFCHRLQIGFSSGDNAYVVAEYEGKAVNTTGSSITVRRYLVMRPADYEARKYPDNITWNATQETATGRVVSGLSGAQQSMKFNQLYDADIFGGSLNYTATVWSWAGRARQTDLINQTSGVGNVTNIARGTYYPTYDTAGQPKDQIPETRNEAFTPAPVTFSAQTSPTSTPNVSLNGSGSRIVSAGSRYHAASLVACMDCHAGASPQPGHETARLGQTTEDDETYCARCHYGTEEPAFNVSGTNYSHLRTYELSAGGFGNGLTNNAPDTGEAEVHTRFVMQQPNNPNVGMFGGRFTPASNAACIACHTHVPADISYTRPDTMTFIANEDSAGNWSVGGYGGTGSNTTLG
jgi:hypothetical protein